MNSQNGNTWDASDSPSLGVDGIWVQNQLDRTGRSQADLARYLKLAPPIINKIIKGRREIKAREAEEIRAFFNLPPVDATGFPQPRAQVDTNVRDSIIDANITPPLRSEMPRDIPILGTVSGGPGGLHMQNGEAIDWARRPPRLRGRADVFGLYVEDLSMIPAFRPGALVLVERARPPTPGDDVVFEVKPSGPREEQRALIKHLVGMTAKIIRLEQYNPPKILEFDTRQILHMYRVMPLADLLGV